MSDVVSFADFLPQFFGLFSSKSFRGSEYLTYLNRPTAQRSGDEAPVVDMAIVAPLLGLLGFEPAERVYNQQRQYGRPDFAPRDALYGTCFIVEDKNTALIPEDAVALNIFFAAVARKIEEITLLLEEIRHIDMEIDERVLDLYSITNPVDRQRVLGSAPLDEDEGENGDEEE